MYLIIMPHTYYYLNHPKPQTQNPYNILDYNMQRFWASSSGFPPLSTKWRSGRFSSAASCPGPA